MLFTNCCLSLSFSNSPAERAVIYGAVHLDHSTASNKALVVYRARTCFPVTSCTRDSRALFSMFAQRMRGSDLSLNQSRAPVKLHLDCLRDL